MPKTVWAATFLTYLSEGPIVKAMKDRLLVNSANYEEVRMALVCILGKPEEKEQARVSLDIIRQQPCEAVADFSPRVLEIVSKA